MYVIYVWNVQGSWHGFPVLSWWFTIEAFSCLLFQLQLLRFNALHALMPYRPPFSALRFAQLTAGRSHYAIVPKTMKLVYECWVALYHAYILKILFPWVHSLLVASQIVQPGPRQICMTRIPLHIYICLLVLVYTCTYTPTYVHSYILFLVCPSKPAVCGECVVWSSCVRPMMGGSHDITAGNHSLAL